MQPLVSKALAAGFAASMAIGGNTTPQMPNVTPSSAATYSQKVTVVFERQAPIDAWIEKLAALESDGKSNIKVLDSNGLHSFGCLQFQMSTFEEFGLKYKLVSSQDNLEKLIYDCVLQKEIAKRMIKENPGNWKKWYTSVATRGLGLPPKEDKPILVSFIGK
jgi:hypothetical protein